MKSSNLVILLLASLSLPIYAAPPQRDGEPIKAPGEVPLSGFPGCSLAPAKNGCEERIVCNGVGTLYGNSGMDLQAATEEALMEAKNELAKFYNSKQKAKQSLAKVREDSQKSTSDGGKAITSSATRLMSSVSSSSAEEVLTGVQVLGREVDTNQQAVTIKVGVSCKSQSAAAKSRAAAKNSNNGSSSDNSKAPTQPTKTEAESYKVGPGNIQNMKQEIQNADDF